MWSIFVFLGIEKVRIVPGFSKTNPFDLYYMPYSHSLPSALLWSLGGFFVYKLWRKSKSSEAFWVGVAIFSHWILDFFVHKPDLPLLNNAYKVGLGLWDYPILTLFLESFLLFGGIWFYFLKTKAVSPSGRYAIILFGIISLAIQSSVLFSPPPPSDKVAALMAFSSYALFTGIIYWLEKKRV